METTIKNGFDFNLPKLENYFGFKDSKITENKWLVRQKENTQFSLFEQKEEDTIKLSISDFTMSLTCPKLFDAYYLSNKVRQTPHHSIVEAGTQFDKHAKKFLIEKKEKRDKIAISNSLFDALNNLKTIELSDERIENYINSFNDFCLFFSFYLFVFFPFVYFEHH